MPSKNHHKMFVAFLFYEAAAMILIDEFYLSKSEIVNCYADLIVFQTPIQKLNQIYISCTVQIQEHGFVPVLPCI